MAYNSKYTGIEIEALLDTVENLNINFVTEAEVIEKWYGGSAYTTDDNGNAVELGEL